MSADAPDNPEKAKARKRSWIVVEAWNDDREINKRIVGDAIKALVVIVCAIAVGYAARFAPGATPDRIRMFETYHFFCIFGLCAYFTALLVTEFTIAFIRRLRRSGNV
jgi:hypothetical protein